MLSAAVIDWKKLIQLTCDAVKQNYENKKRKDMTENLTDAEIEKIEKIKKLRFNIDLMNDKLSCINHFDEKVFSVDPDHLKIDIVSDKYKLPVVVAGVECRRFINNIKQEYIKEINELTKQLKHLIS